MSVDTIHNDRIKDFIRECSGHCLKHLNEGHGFDGIMYHYTNFSSLQGILENRRLRMTHYRYLDDPSEMGYGVKEIIAIINKFMNLGYRDFWLGFIEFFRSYIKTCDVYIASFCMKKDYLTAWRLYGDDGKGFAIGFRQTLFASDSFEVIQCDVKYEHEKLKEKADHIISSVKSLLKEIGLDCNVAMKNKVWEELSVFLSMLIINFKHHAYAEENEYRGVILGATDKAIWYQNSKESSYVGSRQMIPYEFKDDDVSEIWVGPRCTFEHAEAEISSLLKKSGYNITNIKIYQSQVPYKNNFNIGPNDLLLEALTKYLRDNPDMMESYLNQETASAI